MASNEKRARFAKAVANHRNTSIRITRLAWMRKAAARTLAQHRIRVLVGARRGRLQSPRRVGKPRAIAEHGDLAAGEEGAPTVLYRVARSCPHHL